MFDRIGEFLGQYLEFDRPERQAYVSQDFDALCEMLRVGDVLLVEGRAKISSGIKYLTQSTWSHAALCVSDQTSGAPCELIEVTLEEGCHKIPLTKYKGFNTRVCRAVSLDDDERKAVARYAEERIGLRYDKRNIFDLARYLLPFPPIPIRWRRRMMSFGAGDPTRAICSSLIAQAFQSVNYPILPTIEMSSAAGASKWHHREVWHIRHYSMFMPRDFDLSPYFAVVKPTIKKGFDHRKITWAEPEELANTEAEAGASSIPLGEGDTESGGNGQSQQVG
ncbi:YiiX/YebB-like N1pC/P60 family cysteine hydrolase [Pararhodobacter oceanensis]|uniref:Lipo-like protein n=1 Tax=Pararhodobacter oceanensis TaxID=2172121 RepID=A0A2T8HT09_9RHOB|nr:YiiX/YebB-like N1pC/P60 family cysteine hydrolase [Pararhodobacter oceanensis]PVH28551.1 lipo-like protein [Pararhodobacter oceanensis]